MGYVVDDMTTEAAALGIPLVVISAHDVRALSKRVRAKYTPPLLSGRIELNLIDADGVHDTTDWTLPLLGDFIGANSTVMFFEESHDRLGVRFPNGTALVAVLRAAIRPVFYLTDDERQLPG